VYVLTKVALILWIPIAAYFASSSRPPVAAAALMLGATMFLPERVAFNFPLVPPMGKAEIGQLSILVALVCSKPALMRRQIFPSGTGYALGGLMVCAMITAISNTDPQFYGPRVLPAMTLHDGVSLAVRDLFFWGPPFVLGSMVFRTSRDLKDLMRIIVTAAILYSFFILVELRMSPHFHKWTYGFHQHQIRQVARAGGGYRPMVYMAHGLALALFILSAGLASVAVTRAKVRILGLPTHLLSPIMFVILIMCKSLGAILQGLVTFPIMLFASPRIRVRIAAMLGVVLIAYPIARYFGVVPYVHLTNAALKISADRAQSLDFRFTNEELFLTKARDRIWFGWGGHRRARIFDPVSGENEAVPDSFWVIQVSSRGLFGYYCSLGLIVTPILITWRRFSRIRDPADRQLVSGLAMIMGVYCIDMTVNGMFTNLPLFFSGALLGVTTTLSKQPRVQHPRASVAAASRAPVPA
jgi:hypothetical protein